jgi:hypothetical protein
VAAAGLFFSIPKSFTSGKQDGTEDTIASKLAKVDYIGAIALVYAHPLKARHPYGN